MYKVPPNAAYLWRPVHFVSSSYYAYLFCMGAKLGLCYLSWSAEAEQNGGGWEQRAKLHIWTYGVKGNVKWGKIAWIDLCILHTVHRLQCDVLVLPLR
jgi:hypothetical protein